METFHYTMADPQSVPIELLEYGMVVKQDSMVSTCCLIPWKTTGLKTMKNKTVNHAATKALISHLNCRKPII